MHRIICYPGRFQPFGPHHYSIYKSLCTKFGKENVYIATSNHIDERSPLTFEEKKLVITKFGIPADRIVCTKNPYKPDELTSKFNKDVDVLVVCCGQKDYDRINFIKKDGSPSYYKKYTGQMNLEPFSKSGYIYLSPYVKMQHLGNEMCGTYLREIIPILKPEEFKQLFGWYDERAVRLLRNKFENEINRISKILDNINERKSTRIMEVTNQKYTKHIQHPYECLDLTWSDLNEFILEVCQGNLLASPKYDGINLQMTFKDGRVLSSRNKGQVVNPIGYNDLSNISKTEHVNKIFQEAFRVVELMMTGNNFGLDLKIFNNGRTFLNFEIIAPPHNVYSYPTKMIVLHNLITYDELGNKISIENIDFQYPSKIMDYQITDSKPINLNRLVDWSLYHNFEFYLNSLRLENRSNWDDTIELLLDQVLSKLQILILSVGNAIIKNECIPYTKFQENDINNIIVRLEKNIDDIYNSADPNLIEKLGKELKRLKDLGGYSSLNPIEGFVFNWKGRQLKLVGSFAPLNQILGLIRYKK